MILVDSSVWIAYLRTDVDELAEALDADDVLLHPFVLGELACGNLQERTAIMAWLRRVPIAAVAEREAVLAFIHEHTLMGRGIGYVDMNLLVSAVEMGATLWTRDRRTGDAAGELNIRHIERSL